MTNSVGFSHYKSYPLRLTSLHDDNLIGIYYYNGICIDHI